MWEKLQLLKISTFKLKEISGTCGSDMLPALCIKVGYMLISLFKDFDVGQTMSSCPPRDYNGLLMNILYTCGAWIIVCHKSSMGINEIQLRHVNIMAIKLI